MRTDHAARRLRVLVVTTVFPNVLQPVFGLFVLERLKHAAQHAEVRIFAPIAWWRRMRGPVARVEDWCGLRVERPTFFYVPGLFKFLDGFFLLLSLLPRTIRLRRLFPFDLIDAHFGFPEAVAAVCLGRLFSRPVVVTLRGTEIDFLKFRMRTALMRWAIRRADRVIAVSGELAELALSFGADRSRVSVIINGVDTDRFRPIARIEARHRLGLPATRPLLVSVGHLIPRKGFHRLLRTLPAVLETQPAATVAIVGGPSSTARGYPAELDRTIARLGLADHVRMVGPQPPDAVSAWISAADVFVLATDREGCPNVLWEAMACGRPVVAPSVGAVGEMVPPYGGVLIGDADNTEQLRDAMVAALGRTWDQDRIRAHACANSWHSVATRVVAEWNLAVAGASL